MKRRKQPNVRHSRSLDIEGAVYCLLFIVYLNKPASSFETKIHPLADRAKVNWPLGKKMVNIVISKECIVWILLVLWYSELVGANRSLEELILLAM